MKKIILTLAFVLLFSFEAQAQSLQARVNRSVIPEGETFLLTLDLEGVQSRDTPDLSALDKDFIIYSITNAFTTKIVNDAMTQARQWNLVLMPKKTGKLQIPALSVGNLSSQPIVVTVNKAGQTISPQQPGQGQPRFKIEGKTDNANPYVQQQVNYTLTLYDTGGLQGDEPVFMLNNNDEWIIKNLGAPQVTTKVINGRNIREIKFFYALFPQKSGELLIPEVKFNGYYLTKDSRRDPFGNLFADDMFIGGFGMADMFATRNPVVLTAEPIKVSVRPAAAENNGNWWLPASDVELYAQFEPANPVFKAGEAVSRTIYLKAAGVIDSQLPEIRFAEAAGLKQYPEKPQTQMKVENGEVVSLEKISNVYIPQKAGQLTLPEIRVNWFNIKTNKMESAVLPPLTIQVRPGLSNVNEEETAPLTPAPGTRSLPQTEIENTAKAVVTQEDSESGIFWLLIGAFALGIGVSYGLMRLFQKPEEGKIHNYKSYIIEKAKAKDLRGLRDGILAWAAEKFAKPGINSLKDVQDLTGVPEFDCELEKLTEALYAKNSKEWKSGSFIKVFEKVYAKKYRKKNDSEPLPKLYK